MFVDNHKQRDVSIVLISMTTDTSFTVAENVSNEWNFRENVSVLA